ncbi:hypothetical protein [Frankia sp. AvcI1]|uniref:hypothetical protein n=1 Tax=Frankia sp. AvcI1 TaxID=573496 RepID=UPI0005A53D45|nr:hypothetical protein [Frankia sp. AvcI1]
MVGISPDLAIGGETAGAGPLQRPELRLDSAGLRPVTTATATEGPPFERGHLRLDARGFRDRARRRRGLRMV